MNVPRSEKCPVCGSTCHSEPFDVTMKIESTYDYQENLTNYPVSESFVYCLNCGVTRNYY